MPRTPTIWFRKQTGWYCTKIRGIVHKLAKTEPEAKKAFYKLMAKDAPSASRPIERHTVRWFCDKYLDRTKSLKEDETWQIQFRHLKTFCDELGSRQADSLKAHEVNEWLDKQPTWGQSTKGLIVMIVKAVFNWAVAEDYMPVSPLVKLRRRKIARRKRVLSADEKTKLLGAAKGKFHDFLSTLATTGMRPFSEAAKLTAAMIDWEKGRSHLKKHKNAKKDKVRVVYFPPETLVILKRLMQLHPEGLLFRNNRGTTWDKTTIYSRLKRLCKTVGVDGKDVNAYTLRHTFITDALIRGVPVEVVAELVGTSAKMIHDHYASIDQNPDALRAAAAKAVS